MDSSSDDDIELLKQLPGEEGNDNTALVYSDSDSNLNPFGYIKRGSSQTDSVDRASLHALQTAFSSLQKKHNEELKKNKKLVQTNTVMRKALMDATQGSQGHFQSMEEYLQEANLVHAAGGTSEDGSLAEGRTSQGYCQQLQRDLHIANNTITAQNDEIVRLRNANEELERELTKQLKNADEMQSAIEMMKDNFSKVKEESSRKDLEVAQMKNAVQSEQEFNHNLRLKIEGIQEQLESSRKNGITGKNEIHNLKLKLDAAEKERMRILNHLDESEKKVAILEAKCKQYEIEVNINRQHRHEKNLEDFDDVDGENAVLEKALGLITCHRAEVAELKTKIADQQDIISQIQSKKRVLDSSFRPEAQGSSISQPYQEKPLYMNYPNLGGLSEMQSRHSLVSTLSRRRSDRGDYRDMDRVQRTSPRVNDNILPTGNQNITPMLAMESNQQPKRMEVASTVDSGLGAKSPGENSTDSRYGNIIRPENTFARTSISGNVSYDQLSPRNTLSPLAKAGDVFETYKISVTESPKSRENLGSSNISDNHVLLQTNAQASAFVQTGARPRMSTNSSNYLTQYNDSQEPVSPRQKAQIQQIPDRMTQSEIIIRDRSDNPMTRSVLDPLQPLEIPTSRQNEYVHSEIEGIRITPHLGRSEHTYQNQYREQSNGPDYENIYNANAQTEIKRPIEEHDDNNDLDVKYASDNAATRNNVHRLVQQETVEGNVSSVKICPVCNEEFSRLTLDQFQMHVFECFDNCDESPATLQPTAGASPNDDDRNCPMCGDVFPNTVSQEAYEQHVLSHFGEDPLVERFELLQP